MSTVVTSVPTEPSGPKPSSFSVVVSCSESPSIDARIFVNSEGPRIANLGFALEPLLSMASFGLVSFGDSAARDDPPSKLNDSPVVLTKAVQILGNSRTMPARIAGRQAQTKAAQVSTADQIRTGMLSKVGSGP